MKEIDIADADGSDGITVIGQLEMEKGILRTGSRVALLPVLDRHFEGHFNSRGSVVGIEDAAEAFWRDSNELTRQSNGWRVGKTEQRRMGDTSKLCGQRTIQARMSVAMNVHPDGGRAVEIFSSIRIDQVAAVALLDDHRKVLFPFLHLREWMPQIGMVPCGESSGVGRRRHEGACIRNDGSAGIQTHRIAASREL